MGASWNEYKIFSVYLLPLNPLQVIGAAIPAAGGVAWRNSIIVLKNGLDLSLEVRYFLNQSTFARAELAFLDRGQ